jgi:DHA1 family bicyclomycin/chloramphenicol resistance-like MFS transporter
LKLFSPVQRLPFVEFIALMALTTSIVALCIDGMLPALPQIGRDLGVSDPNGAQLVISMLFLGMGIGQLIFGPLSDSIGRKPSLYIGVVVFIIGCLMSIFATTFEMMIAGRIIQGIGASGPRIVPMALIRDEYEGRGMARIMSLISMVFILVPMLAPLLGQVIIYFFDWRAIFTGFLILSIVLLLWFATRQPETLVIEKRKELSFKSVAGGFKEVFKSRTAIGYTASIGMVSGAFIAYLATAQPILQDQYELGLQFPAYFAVLSLSIGISSYLNSRLVMKWGMRFLSFWALVFIIASSVIFAVYLYLSGVQPSLWLFMAYMTVILFFTGVLFGNVVSMAMEPLGHVAGVGAAVVGSLSTFISVPFGVLVGHSYNGSVMPLVLGFAGCCLVSLWLMRWAEGGTDFV